MSDPFRTKCSCYQFTPNHRYLAVLQTFPRKERFNTYSGNSLRSFTTFSEHSVFFPKTQPSHNHTWNLARLFLETNPKILSFITPKKRCEGPRKYATENPPRAAYEAKNKLIRCDWASDEVVIRCYGTFYVQNFTITVLLHQIIHPNFGCYFAFCLLPSECYCVVSADSFNSSWRFEVNHP